MKLRHLSLLLLIGLLGACDSYLDTSPSTEITSDKFFNTLADLETYTNGFYSMLEINYRDAVSDNISLNTNGGYMQQLLRGAVTPGTADGWDWENLRQINYFLDNYQRVDAPAEEVNHYVGIARFFRAMFYYHKVLKYNEVPWYSKALNTDSEELYKPQDARTAVVDSIFADLQFAVEHLKPLDSKTRINKYTALHYMARVALYEASWRKYHPELELDNYQKYYKIAIDAATQIINSGRYEIYATGDPSRDYGSLFNSTNLSSNPEVILYADFSDDLDRHHNAWNVTDYTWALSRSLADAYLMRNTGEPFTSLPGADTLTVTEVFEGRDPRMQQTVMRPGYVIPGSSDPYRMKPYLGGYLQIKFHPLTPDQDGWYNSYTDIPIFRYAETLLIYAEAKAELGRLTQSDLDRTVNELRNRAGMPPMVLGEALSGIDPVLAERYYNVKGSQKGAILEIRRERRVELACEGFRQDDLMRWGLGKIFEKPRQGMYVDGLGAMDVTGDGTPDIAILAAPGKTGPIEGLPAEVQNQLSLYYLVDKSGNPNSFYLSEGDHGHIMFTTFKTNPPAFVEPKYYYHPIPELQLVLNEKLHQPPGW